MTGGSAPADIGMSVVHGCLLVPVQGEVFDDTVLWIQAQILKQLETGCARAVIIDLSAVRVLDTFAFGAFAATAKAAGLLGAATILAGIQPGVASALIDLDVPFDGIRTAVTLEDAFRQLRAGVPSSVEPEEVDDSNAEEESPEESECDGQQRDIG